MGKVRCALTLVSASLPAAQLGLLAFLAWALTGAGGVFVEEGALFLRCSRLYGRLTRYSVTMGMVVLLHPNHNEVVREHELIHVGQFKGDSLSGLVLGLLLLAAGAPWWASAALWALHHQLVYAGHSVASWLRGERFYLDNAYERHARYEAGQGLL